MSHALLEFSQAAYSLEGDTRSWIKKVARAALPQMGLGEGALTQVFQVQPAKTIYLGRVDAAAQNLIIVRALDKLGAPLSRVCSSSGPYRSSELYGAEISPILKKLGSSFLPQDCLGFIGHDALGGAAGLAFPTKLKGAVSAKVRGYHKAAWPHLGAGLRLRRSVHGLKDDSPLIEARLRSDGHCLGAVGAARSKESRDLLKKAVLDSEAKRQSRTHAQGFASFDAVVAGRWSLVERFESNGTRYHVAYRNPPGVGDLRALSKAEEEVARLASEGLTNKEIACALGVKQSTATGLLTSTLKKLGLSSPLSLPALWKNADESAQVMGRDDLAYFSVDRHLPPSVNLTLTEDEIVTALMAGLSNQEIASKRGTSPRTVANQVASILQKLKVRSRRELAALLSAPKA